MTVGAAEPNSRLRELIDRAELFDLVNRYVVLLDTQDDDGFSDSWPDGIFTEDVRLELPIGDYEGLDGLAEFHYDAKRRFVRTHHMSGPPSVRIEGDSAVVRCQVIATHVYPEAVAPRHGGHVDPLFVIGGYYEGEAVRTERGWRLRRWCCRVVWHRGVSPVELP